MEAGIFTDGAKRRCGVGSNQSQAERLGRNLKIVLPKTDFFIESGVGPREPWREQADVLGILKSQLEPSRK